MHSLTFTNSNYNTFSLLISSSKYLKQTLQISIAELIFLICFEKTAIMRRRKKFFYIQISGEMLAMLPRIVWFPNLSIEQYFFMNFVWPPWFWTVKNTLESTGWYEVDVITSWGCTGPSSAQAGIWLFFN